jgi:hypothetical protein
MFQAEVKGRERWLVSRQCFRASGQQPSRKGMCTILTQELPRASGAMKEMPIRSHAGVYIWAPTSSWVLPKRWASRSRDGSLFIGGRKKFNNGNNHIALSQVSFSSALFLSLNILLENDQSISFVAESSMLFHSAQSKIKLIGGRSLFSQLHKPELNCVSVNHLEMRMLIRSTKATSELHKHSNPGSTASCQMSLDRKIIFPSLGFFTSKPLSIIPLYHSVMWRIRWNFVMSAPT